MITEQPYQKIYMICVSDKNLHLVDRLQELDER